MGSVHNKEAYVSFEKRVMPKKAHILLSVALILSWIAQGQEADTSAWQWHMSVGSAVEAGFGHTQSQLWVAPRIDWQPSQRLKVSGGFAATATLFPYLELQGKSPRNLAPRKQGTRVGALWAEAEVQTGERTWLWGRVAYANGFAQPLWRSGAMPVEVVALSGGVAHEFAGGQLLELHVHVLHDLYGTAHEALGLGHAYGPWGSTWGMEAWPHDMAFRW